MEFELITMIRKIIIILFLIALTFCKYDYIYENPNHPKEYIGSWLCDSTYLNGIKNNTVEKRNFLIMQNGVDITLNIRNISNYYDWKVDKSENITTFILFNIDYIPQATYDVVQEPLSGILALKFGNVTYFLSH